MLNWRKASDHVPVSECLVCGNKLVAEGVGTAPTSALCGSCFQDRCSQLLSACLPTNGTRGRGLAFIFVVSSGARYIFSYASKHPGALKFILIVTSAVRGLDQR